MVSFSNILKGRNDKINLQSQMAGHALGNHIEQRQSLLWTHKKPQKSKLNIFKQVISSLVYMVCFLE